MRDFPTLRSVGIPTLVVISVVKSLNYSGSHSTMLWYGAYQSMVLTVPKCGTIFGTVVGLLYMGHGCCASMISMYMVFSSFLAAVQDFLHCAV